MCSQEAGSVRTRRRISVGVCNDCGVKQIKCSLSYSSRRHVRRPHDHRSSAGYCYWLLVLLVVLSALLPAPATACGPGRGANRRRSPRKLTPLVFKQHVPNVSENTLGASGLTEGKITRDDPRFQQLVPNYNTDIVFKDEEGTGADRLMTQRCKEKLNTLAISVMNQWPGVKLRVTEGWDEEGLHAANSLHYEGRGVDITTSDRDRSKYGMLARLAVEAGFDWVYYESRAHIHASVKSESSQAARHGGCFPPESTVLVENGTTRKLSELSVGDRIQSMDSQGRLVFSPVLLFLDRDLTEERDFVQLQSADGATVTMTASHLIYTVASQDLLEDVDIDLTNEQLQSNSLTSDESSSAEDEDRLLGQLMANATMERFGSRLKATFASKVQIGDWIVSTGPDGRPKPQRVVGVSAVSQRGVLAPLTEEGTLVVDQVVVSCYAVIDDQTIAHLAFSPVRLLNNVHKSLVHFWRAISWWNHDRTTVDAAGSSIPVKHVEARSMTNENRPPTLVGIHWYAKLLYRIARVVLPSHLVFN